MRGTGGADRVPAPRRPSSRASSGLPSGCHRDHRQPRDRPNSAARLPSALPLLSRRWRTRIATGRCPGRVCADGPHGGKRRYSRPCSTRAPRNAAQRGTGPALNCRYRNRPSRSWAARLAGHRRSGACGGGTLFRHALRGEFQPVAKTDHGIVPAGAPRERTVRLDEQERSPFRVHARGLDMIAGGESGPRFVARGRHGTHALPWQAAEIAVRGVVAELVGFRDSRRGSGGPRAWHGEAGTCPAPHSQTEILQRAIDAPLVRAQWRTG